MRLLTKFRAWREGRQQRKFLKSAEDLADAMEPMRSPITGRLPGEDPNLVERLRRSWEGDREDDRS